MINIIIFTFFTHFFLLIFHMSKLEFVNNHLKNAKINNKQMEKICHFFTYDYTASQTAKELGLSRQTINSYYKMIRTALLEEYNEINNIILNNSFAKNLFILKYLSIHSNTIYYIEYNDKIYLLDNKYTKLNKIVDFIEDKVKNTLINHKRANSARVLYDTHQDEYIIASFLKSTNDLEEFVAQRLKKFRGLNKNNISMHIEESIIRFDTNNTSISKTLKRIFNF